MSLWSPQKGNDYKFIDEMVRGHLEHGGTALLVHKYIAQGEDDGDPKNPPVEDLLFLENRVRKYDDVIYELRGSMVIVDQDYDLSQFGLFLGSDQTIFTVHINSMVQMMGRKIMAGDVIELPFQRDDLMIDEDSPAVNQYWVVQEATREAGGYDPGWWPHLWRIKAKQLQDSIEYADIFGTGEEADDLKNLLSTYNSDVAIADGVLEEAEANVPGDYYDIETHHILNTRPDLNIPDIESGIRFPVDPVECQYFMRIDYAPNRIFQYMENKWHIIHADESCIENRGVCDISDLGIIIETTTAISCELNDMGMIAEDSIDVTMIDEGILDLGIIIEEGLEIPKCTGNPPNGWQVGNILHKHHINNTRTFKDEDGNIKPSKVNLSKVVKPKAG